MTVHPISDYAMIGDCETAALVGLDGSIDWLCWPRFDSGACFTALLGTHENGHWRLAPQGLAKATRRRYRDETLILETEFDGEDGAVTIIDFMPIRSDPRISELVRIARCTRGSVRMRMDLKVRFDYGRIIPWVTRREAGGLLRAVAGPHAIYFRSPVQTRGEDHGTVADFTLNEGEEAAFVLAYESSTLPPPDLCDATDALDETDRFWSDWSAQCRYEGKWREAVMRSLITVKALIYRRTGGIVAAPTTSLPEKVGGERNWDYRYCWLRDATFTLLSLINAGYRREAEEWCDWVLRAVAGAASQTQPLYGIAGEHRVDEIEIHSLPGYRDSRPVRIGNAAYSQLQIDAFGSVVDVLYEAREFGLELHEASDGLICELLRHLEKVWRKPDEGIWEVRSESQHFVHAKLLAWVAFDRGVKLADKYGLNGPVERWRKLREEIHAEICERGWSEKRQAFVQAYGTDALDASLLLMSVYGFLPGDDPRIVATERAIESHLIRGGFVLRYDTEESVDGLEGEEGAFLACSFWLADNMILQGRRKDAEAVYERLLALRNDVGLLSEQWDWHEKEFVGNFPQAFSHFALIDTAFNFDNISGAAREEKDA